MASLLLDRFCCADLLLLSTPCSCSRLKPATNPRIALCSGCESVSLINRTRNRVATLRSRHIITRPRGSLTIFSDHTHTGIFTLQSFFPSLFLAAYVFGFSAFEFGDEVFEVDFRGYGLAVCKGGPVVGVLGCWVGACGKEDSKGFEGA